MRANAEDSSSLSSLKPPVLKPEIFLAPSLGKSLSPASSPQFLAPEYSSLNPLQFQDWDPEDLEQRIQQTLSPPLPQEDRNRFTVEPINIDNLLTGDILLGLGEVGRLFMSGVICRSTGSCVTDVAVVIKQVNQEVMIFTVSDLDPRFYHYPEYQKPLELLRPLEKWLKEFPGKVYVKRIPEESLSERRRSLIPLYAQTIFEEYSTLNPNEVTLCLNSVVVTRLFQAIGISIPHHSSYIVPGHFVSLYPFRDEKTTFGLLHIYDPPPPKKPHPQEVLYDVLMLHREELAELGACFSTVYIDQDQKLVVQLLVDSSICDEKQTPILEKIKHCLNDLNLDFTIKFERSHEKLVR